MEALQTTLATNTLKKNRQNGKPLGPELLSDREICFQSKLQQQKFACRVLGVQCYLQRNNQSKWMLVHRILPYHMLTGCMDCTFPAFLHLGKENHVQITAFARFAEGNILSRNKILEFSGAKFERGNILTHRQSTSKHILSCWLQVIGCCGN